VIGWKHTLLDRAFDRFESLRGPLREEFDAFVRERGAWLDDFALFMALKQALGRSWNEWDEGLALRYPDALAAARVAHRRAIEAERFRQFVFFRQWRRLREHAHARSIRIVGDLPIFVAYDSADVWANPSLFQLDDRGRPTVVAGVPPDYFSATGQLWGNPLYRWDALASTEYAWWIERLRGTLEIVDVVRLDHFRGFEAYWEIPASAPTAESGRWVKGPGRALFDVLGQALGELPVIAEDLGDITPEVVALKDALGFPGMAVLQFAFGSGAANLFLPHNFVRQSVVYTGTHDNDTSRGWYDNTSTTLERDYVRRYLGTDGHDIAWDLIRLAFASVADTAIVPLQDVLDIGSEGRMNLPGRVEGNWGWRYEAEALAELRGARLRELATLYGRVAIGD
jgi:4-alpha-glucanotransferase